MSPTGDDLLRVLAALANPHRLRVIAALTERSMYVSQLARALAISRPLLQVHLRKLETAGLLTATLTVSDEGKAMKYYQVTPFMYELSAASISAATRSLTAPVSEAFRDPEKGSE